MPVERITDDNYASFRKSKRAVLVASATWCPACNTYKPVVSALAEAMPYVHFGEAVLDEGHLGQLKRDYRIEELPTTILIRGGEDVFRFEGSYNYNSALAIVRNNLVIGSSVHVRMNNKPKLPWNSKQSPSPSVPQESKAWKETSIFWNF